MGIFDKACERAEADAANPQVMAVRALADEHLRGMFGGKPIRAQPELVEIGRALMPGERPVALTQGELDKKRGVACLTDARVIFVEVGVTRHGFLEFPLEDVQTVSFSGVMNVKLTIGSKYGGATTIDKTMPPNSARRLSEAFREVVAQRRASVTTVGMAEELGKLADLRVRGVLSEEEWDRAKALFLGKAPDAREQTVLLLGQLHNLYTAGALSESEFNLKKWDLLSKP